MDVIVDIDGTLADCTHRLHHIQKRPKDWDAFFAATAGDAPIKPVLALIHSLRTGNPSPVMRNRLIFCSGRPERTRPQTEMWLLDNNILVRAPDQCSGATAYPLYMRADGDRRDDDILKRELLARIRADGFDPVLAIDDRRRVVDMWREEGLVCAQVAAGDF